MERRDRDDPLDDDADLSDDDWVPPEIFGPADASNRSTTGSGADEDTSATLESADYFESATATDVASDNDLAMPQMSELWPDEVASAGAANDHDLRAEGAPPADALAATMLQTAESFAEAPLPPAEAPRNASLEHTQVFPVLAVQAAPVIAAPAIAAPLSPAESLTTTALQQVTRDAAPASSEASASAFRPWVADQAAQKSEAVPPAPVPPARPAAPAPTFWVADAPEQQAEAAPPAPAAPPRPAAPAPTVPLAPPIPPLRQGSPEAGEVSAPRPVQAPAVVPPPPPRPPTPVTPTVAPPAAPPAIPPRRVAVPKASAPPPRAEAAEPRISRVPRQAPAAPPAKPPSAEPLAAVKRSLAVLERLLAMTVSRGAGTLYLAANARPTIRLHGEVQVLDGTPVLAKKDVDTLLRSLMLAQNADPQTAASGAGWCFDLPGAGRVRCMTFHDHRGRGAIFRIGPRRAIAAEQLALPVEVQSLALERDGLVLVAGPRSSGKGVVVAGLLDLINRTRRAYVITVEREVNVSLEREGSFISQREARGGLEEMVTVARAALRENPDVLVLQELRSAPLVNLAFDAAASGQLVIAGFTAPSAGGAVERIIKLYPRESARGVQLLLSQHLRAVISQVLVPKVGGGRAAAREVLLNTSAVANALADGKAWQIPGAIEAGRSHGMVPFSDALAALVQAGTIAADEAYRHAPDRAGFLEALKRHGIDPSSAMRHF